MNHRLFLAFFLSIGLAALVAACSDASGHMEAVDKLLVQSDAVAEELNGIDSTEIETLFESSADVKKQFKQYVKSDTLDLAFAEQLDQFLQANRLLKGLSTERSNCLAANIKAKKRLTALKKDLEAGSGDRSRYAEFVSSETKEMHTIRTHSNSIAQRFATAKSAIEQFQPVIERFISPFVPPSAP